MHRTAILFFCALAVVLALWFNSEKDAAAEASTAVSDGRSRDAGSGLPASELRDASLRARAGSGVPVEGVGDSGRAGDSDPELPGPAARPNDLEAEAARVAESLGLVSPEQLDARVDLRVPEGSLSPDQLERARAQARQEILADEAVVEDLVNQRYGPDASETDRKKASDLAKTLLSGQDDDYREGQLEGLPERLAE